MKWTCHNTHNRLIFSLFFGLGYVLSSSVSLAQLAQDPISYRYVLTDVDRIDQVEMPSPFPTLTAPRPVGPSRVAVPMPATFGLDQAGTWEDLPEGGSVWRFRVDMPQAHFMSYKFSEFRLPAGAQLFFVSVYRDFYVGPFTHQHNQASGRFGSPVIAGDASVIELVLPDGKQAAALTLESVSYGYKNALGMGRVPYRNTLAAQNKAQSQPLVQNDRGNKCLRDINCELGADFQDEKRAIVQGYDGKIVCSGQLINNVRQDGRYLYLTAAHCGWHKDPSTMTYYWNYENSGCGTDDAPIDQTSTGSTDLYHHESAQGDVNLLELHGSNLEKAFDIYFLGWNRGDALPTAAAIISHPDDLPKKIATSEGHIVDCATDRCPDGWGPNYWRITEYTVGDTAFGSSGGGLLDQNHLLVGNLTGGEGDTCSGNGWDEYAKLSAQWDQLQPYLDPDNTGALSLPGLQGQPADSECGNSLVEVGEECEQQTDCADEESCRYCKCVTNLDPESDSTGIFGCSSSNRPDQSSLLVLWLLLMLLVRIPTNSPTVQAGKEWDRG